MIAELSSKQIPFARECFAESARVNTLITPMLVAARRELEIPISEERYAEILHQTRSKQEGQLDEFIRDIAAVNIAEPTS
jgi:hypothetical protein